MLTTAHMSFSASTGVTMGRLPDIQTIARFEPLSSLLVSTRTPTLVPPLKRRNE